ncbi:hypothetical protein QW131_31060 [Roseibium salinum]|nr:hypothetical protein [Roseibium salinum]
MNAGRSTVVEDGIDELVADGVASGRLSATTDAVGAVASTEASFVCVGTPSDPDGSVGLAHVIAACEHIGRAIADKRDRHGVIVRSTIVPGTMKEVCVPTLEVASGLRAGSEFGVGYFPEFFCAKARLSPITTTRASSSSGPSTRRRETFLASSTPDFPAR